MGTQKVREGVVVVVTCRNLPGTTRIKNEQEKQALLDAVLRVLF